MTRRDTVRMLAIVVGAAVTVGASACTRGAPSAAGPEPEQVQVAYGSQDRDRISGSVASLDMDIAEAEHYNTVEEMLQGRVPGVQVTRTTRGFSVRIRGTGTLGAGAEPLYIVDGMPMLPMAGSGGIGVSPQDVARIEVLKDASAAALYGTRGANGVVIIATRRGP